MGYIYMLVAMTCDFSANVICKKLFNIDPMVQVQIRGVFLLLSNCVWTY